MVNDYKKCSCGNNLFYHKMGENKTLLFDMNVNLQEFSFEVYGENEKYVQAKIKFECPKCGEINEFGSTI